MQAVMAASTPRRSSPAASNVACNNIVAATAANGGAGCVGGTVALAVTDPAGATYRWTGPNNYSSTQQSPPLPRLTLAVAGTYTVVAVTTGACANSASTTVAVTLSLLTPVLATTAPTV